MNEDVDVNKPETRAQVSNKGSNIDCSLICSEENKVDADQKENKHLQNKDSWRNFFESNHSPACSSLQSVCTVDAATMTEPVSESYPEQEIASKSSHFEPTAVIPTTSAWHSLSAASSSTMVEYLSRLTASTLPITFHHFLKYSAATNEENSFPNVNKVLKEKVDLKNEPKGRSGKECSTTSASQVKVNSVHLTTTLDGSMLFCCPECHMAYPEKELLQQHLLVHQLERRFVCDICGVGLKRKEHLDRHKQGHSPDRPYTCSICLKAFKRNEHLSRHFITHSGDKSQICIECGKGFYRKDHLHKHAQSHIAKRLRTEFYGKKGDISTSFVPSNEDSASGTLRSDASALPVLSS